MPEQVVINSLEFARNGEALQGSVTVAALGRLQDLLFSHDGVLDYALTGRRGDNGKLYLACTVKGELQLRCQRCLEALAHPVSIDSELELIEDEAAPLGLVDEDDLNDAIQADPKMDVLALVEDEVLLGLPMASMHEPQACKVKLETDQAGSGKQNAFGALAALKSQKLRN